LPKGRQPEGKRQKAKGKRQKAEGRRQKGIGRRRGTPPVALTAPVAQVAPVLCYRAFMRRHHEAASAAAVLWVLAGVPAAIAWTQAVIQKVTKRPR
jgi:hypothetical protein